jgi:hypothetical protein
MESCVREASSCAAAITETGWGTKGVSLEIGVL